jgi:hypothetical protein
LDRFQSTPDFKYGLQAVCVGSEHYPNHQLQQTSIISNNLSTKPYWKVLQEWSSDWNSNPTPTSDRIQTGIQTWFEQEKGILLMRIPSVHKCNHRCYNMLH